MSVKRRSVRVPPADCLAPVQAQEKSSLPVLGHQEPWAQDCQKQIEVLPVETVGEALVGTSSWERLESSLEEGRVKGTSREARAIKEVLEEMDGQLKGEKKKNAKCSLRKNKREPEKPRRNWCRYIRWGGGGSIRTTQGLDYVVKEGPWTEVLIELWVPNMGSWKPPIPWLLPHLYYCGCVCVWT